MSSDKQVRSNKFADTEIEFDKPKSNPVEFYEHSTSNSTASPEEFEPSFKPNRSKLTRRILMGILAIIAAAVVVGALNPELVRDVYEGLNPGVEIEKLPGAVD